MADWASGSTPAPGASARRVKHALARIDRPAPSRSPPARAPAPGLTGEVANHGEPLPGPNDWIVSAVRASASFPRPSSRLRSPCRTPDRLATARTACSYCAPGWCARCAVGRTGVPLSLTHGCIVARVGTLHARERIREVLAVNPPEGAGAGSPGMARRRQVMELLRDLVKELPRDDPLARDALQNSTPPTTRNGCGRSSRTSLRRPGDRGHRCGRS